MQTRVYVDGFNLYYGALKGTKFKWLNLVELARHVLPADHTIDKLIYFTARVSGVSDRDAPRRQQVYLKALNTLPRLSPEYWLAHGPDSKSRIPPLYNKIRPALIAPRVSPTASGKMAR